MWLCKESLILDSELESYLRFEVFAAVKMLMLVFWVVMPCGLVGRISENGVAELELGRDIKRGKVKCLAVKY
jgi:hypothetical protein